jgi:hypothetical protein
MRWALATLFLLTACAEPKSDSVVPARPPEQVDRAAELRAKPIAPESFQLSPDPEPWMLGCFDLHLAQVAPHEPPIVKRIRLTTELSALSQQGIQSIYVVRGDEATSSGEGTWVPRDGGRVTVGFSNGFTGWTLDLARTEAGLAGEARPFKDTGPQFEGPARPVTLARRPCR